MSSLSKYISLAGQVGLLITIVSQLHAKSTQAGFLQKTPSPRASALGGNQTALSNSFDAVFSNPASLSSLSMPELWLAHGESIFKTRYETLGFGFSREKNAFGMVGQYSTVGRFTRTGIDSNNLPVTNLGDFKPFQTVFQLSYARSLTKDFSAGISGKGWWERLDQQTNNGVAFDAGFQGPLYLRNLSWGAGVRNAGTKTDGFSLPTTYSLGAAYKMNHGLLKSFSLLSEYELADHRSDAVRSGLEFRKQFIQLRGGYAHYTSDNADELGDISLGAGFRINGWHLDYAWTESDLLGEEHQFALTLGFGLTPDQIAANAKKLDEAMANRIKFRADNHFRAGESAFNDSNWSLAIHEYTQAINWDPNHARAEDKLLEAREKQITSETNRLYKKGLRQMKKGKAIEAALSFREALKFNPENKAVIKALMKAKKRFSKSKRSVKEYQRKAKARSLTPALSKAEAPSTNKQIIETLSQNAYTFYMLGNIEEATNIWKKILLIDPTNSDAQWAVTQISDKRNPVFGSKKADSSKRVIELNSKALELYSAGNYRRALLYWKKALALDPRNIRIKNSIIRVEKEMALGGGQ